MPPLHHLIKPSQARDLLQVFANLIPGSRLALLRSDRKLFAQAGEPETIPPPGEMDSGAAGFQPLFAGDELVAYLAVSPQAGPVLSPLVQSLSLIIQQALEKREIARETLDRYREINLLYNIAETIGACLDPDEIPALVLNESSRVIPADAGLVLMRSDEGSGDLVLAAERPFTSRDAAAGNQLPSEGVGLLANAQELVDRVMETGRPDLTSTDEYPFITLLCAPLKARERALGAVVLARRPPQAGVPKPNYSVGSGSAISAAPLVFTAGDEKLLMALAGQAGIAIEKAWMHRQELQRQRLEQELAIGRQIQRSLLPEMVPHFTGWEFAAYYQSAREVGGDFYDFFETTADDVPSPGSTPAAGGHSLGLFIADVTGKGVPAALMMAFSRAMLRTLLHAGPQYVNSPAKALLRLNDLLLRDNRTGLLLTALYASLDPASGRLAYANAGHELPIWLQHATGDCRELVSRGAILGAFGKVSIEECQVDLAPGDMVVFYTDGITEARNPTGELFGEDRLLETVKTCQGASAEQSARVILEAAQSFASGAPQADDFTIVVLKRAL